MQFHIPSEVMYSNQHTSAGGRIEIAVIHRSSRHATAIVSGMHFLTMFIIILHRKERVRPIIVALCKYYCLENSVGVESAFQCVV